MDESTRTRLWAPIRHFLGGYASGVALVLAGHPFDTIKVRLQTQGLSGRFKGPIDCLLGTIRKEGFFALYKGASPPLVMTGFVNSVMFGLMGMCRQNKLNNMMKKGENNELGIKQVMVCAIEVGFILAFIVAPMEHIKAKLQVQYNATGTTRQYNGPIDCVKQLIKKGGPSRLWVGLIPTMLHRGSNWSYFGGYELARRFLSKDSSKLSPVATLAAGSFAGTCFWFSCYPIDVIKNRMQAAPDVRPLPYKNSLDCAKQIYRHEGFKGFFKGFTPCLIRSVPANSAAFFAFEVTMQLLPK